MTNDTPHPSPNSVPAIKIRGRKSTGSWVSAEAVATPQPGPDAELEALPAEQPRTPERSLLGLASMLRSGGYIPDDAGWVSRSLEHSAAAIATLTARAERAEGERDAAQAREARLREALEPFAEEADYWDRNRNGDEPWPDEEFIDSEHGIVVGNLRAARAALSPEPQAADTGERG